MVFLKLLIVCLLVRSTASLECFSCPGSADLSACNRTVTCRDGQACYHNASSANQGQVFSLGCIDNKKCDAPGNISSTMVGRDLTTRQSTNCLECCSTDHCNKNLCGHLKPNSLCKSNPCIHGKCFDINESFFCLCDDGYMGKQCNIAFCSYRGQIYTQDQTWNDGCIESCTCTNAAQGMYSCRAMCLTWNSLPSVCHLEDPKPPLCCQQPKCPSGIIINIPKAYKAEYPGYTYV